MTGVLTAFILFVLFPVVILGFILLSRYLKYRETLTMIQHGITPPQPMMPMPPPPMMQRPPVVVNQGNGGAGRGTLIWGLDPMRFAPPRCRIAPPMKHLGNGDCQTG